jgi:hypothetical protein
VRERGDHAAGERLVVGARLERVEPHQPVRASGESRDLAAQELRVAAVPAVGEDHHHGPSANTSLALSPYVIPRLVVKSVSCGRILVQTAESTTSVGQRRVTRRTTKRRLLVAGVVHRIRPALGLLAAAILGGCGVTAADPSNPPDTVGTLFLETTTSDKLIAVDTHTGRSRTLPIRLGCGDADFCLVASDGKLVIGSVGATYVYDPLRPGPPRRRTIGPGWIIVPSTTEGRVWLGLLDHRSRAAVRARRLRALREETVDGRVTRTVRPPGGKWPAGTVNAGLLFQTAHGLRLWDARTRAVARRLPGAFPVDTHANLVAHCGEPCPHFEITDARTGDTTRVKPPAGYSFQAGYDGAFSPDGSLLALPVVADRGRRRGDYPPWLHRRSYPGWAVALVDVASGSARVINASRLDPIYPAMAWSASGARLFFGAGRGTIMAYAPGAPRAREFARIPIKPGGSILHMAAL